MIRSTLQAVWRRQPLWPALFWLALAGSAWAADADIDTATTRLSDKGAFKVSINSRVTPIEINRIHSWVLHVATRSGAPVERARIAIDGGMPRHDHGLPTAPRVTENLGGGDYLIEGMKFQMPGHWVVTFDIRAGGQTDSVTFNLLL